LTLPAGYIPVKDGELKSDDKLQILWQGVVKVDDSIDDYVSNISHTGSYKRYEIKDVKYKHENYHTTDNQRYSLGYSLVTVDVLAESESFDEYMHAAAFIRYQLIEKQRGLIRKEKYFERRPDLKGFLLRRITIQGDKQALNSVPVLASYRANIGGDNAFSIQREGHIALYSSSSSSAVYNDPARISLTCVFVASNDNMFVAQQRVKSRMSLVECNSGGFKTKAQDKGTEKEKKPSNTKSPIEILKARLAKGEITVQQYEELKKVLDEG
jgi:hypothetical protein